MTNSISEDDFENIDDLKNQDDLKNDVKIT